MRKLYRILAVTTLTASLMGPMSFAQNKPIFPTIIMTINNMTSTFAMMNGRRAIT